MRRSVAVGAVVAAVLIGAAVVGLRRTGDDGDSTRDAVAGSTTLGTSSTPSITRPVSTLGSSTIEPTTVPADSVPTATTMAPADELATKVADELQPLIEASSRNDLLPANLRPSLRKTPSDKTALVHNGCMASWGSTANPTCVFGDINGTVTIALFGDSHAAEWFPGLDIAGKKNGWKILALTKMGCPSVDVSVKLADGSPYGGCDRWRWLTILRLQKSDASLIIMTNFRYAGAKQTITIPVWKAGLARTVKALKESGKQVLTIADTPFVGESLIGCIRTHPTSLHRCDRSRDAAIIPAYQRAATEVAAQYRTEAYDATDWLCTSVCPAVIGEISVYLDGHHITNTYGQFLAPYLELLVKSILVTT